MSRQTFVVGGLLLLVGAVACGSSGSDASPSCADVAVDRFKELVIVEPSVIEDARARNADAGVWSFRHAMENMAPPGADASELVHSWLLEWVDTHDLNGYPLDRPNEQRDGQMNRRIICPWLHRTASNACDDTCGSCAARKLDLALAPFRLLAITNRIDLRDEVESEPQGEARLVFAATDGAADDPGSPALPMTIIFEYFLSETRSLGEWARAWHALGRFPAFDETYRVALEGVTNGFTKRGARPAGVNGSALAQIRTNESALDWIWQLREFALDGSGGLHIRPLRNTPPAALNNTQTLADYVVANAGAIKNNRFELPTSLRGGSADQLLYSWSLPGVDEPTRKAFARNTCNGCHSAENPSVDTVFHVSPFRRGVERLSPFLNDPGGKPDQLTLRTASLSRALCAAQ